MPRLTGQRLARRAPLRFSTQTLLLQLGVVALVVLLTSAVHVWLTYDRLGREAENQALTLARTVASDPNVRAEVQQISAQPGAGKKSEDGGDDDERQHGRQLLRHDQHHEYRDHGES